MLIYPNVILASLTLGSILFTFLGLIYTRMLDYYSLDRMSLARDLKWLSRWLFVMIIVDFVVGVTAIISELNRVKDSQAENVDSLLFILVGLLFLIFLGIILIEGWLIFFRSPFINNKEIIEKRKKSARKQFKLKNKRWKKPPNKQ